MKNKLLLCVFFLCWQMPFSFAGELDSLLLIYNKGKANASVYNQLAAQYYEINVDSGKYFAQLALDNALFNNDIAQIAEAYYQIGDAYYYSDQIDSTIVYYRKSLEYYLETNLNEEIAGVYNDIGYLLIVQHYPDSSRIYINLALDYIDKELSPEGYFHIMINKADSYYNNSDFVYALEVYEFVLHQGDIDLSLESKSTLYNNLALCYNKTSNYNKAIQYYKKSIHVNNVLAYIFYLQRT